MADDPYAEFGEKVAAPKASADPYAEFGEPVTTKGPLKTFGAAMAVGQKPPAQFEQPQGAGTPLASVPGKALESLPSSAGNFIHNLAQPFLHPVDTANSLIDLSKGVVSKVLDPRLFQDEATPPPEGPEAAADRANVEGSANAFGQHMKDRYGSWEGIKNTMATDPVGFLADASIPLTGGGGVAARVPGVVGKVGEVASTIGRNIDPLTVAGNAVRLPTKYAGEPLASNALGMTTGAGPEAIRQTAKAGVAGDKTFTENMRGNVPVTDIVDTAREALGKMREERSAAYKGDMSKLAQDKTVLDFQPVEDAVAKASEVGSFKGVPVNRSATDVNGKIAEIVKEWKGLDPAEFHTPEGLDALKRTIGDLRDSTDYGTPARVAADRVYNAVKAEIQKQAPAYAKTMEDYSTASDKLKEATKTFSLGEKATGDTAVRKLQSVLRNNVQTNYGARAQLLDELATHEPSLPSAIAGQSMNALAPRGLTARLGSMASVPAAAVAGTANPLSLAAIPALAAFSPRLMGEMIYGGGRAVAGANALRINASNVRNAGRATYQLGRNNALAQE